MARISEKCPQCSASIEFEEDKSVIRCQWCGSALLVSGTEGIQSFRIQPRIADPPQARAIAERELKGVSPHEWRIVECVLLHVPFWRIQGRSYCWVFGTRLMGKSESDVPFPKARERARELITRIIDHTLPAFRSYCVGLQTLGIRPQVATLSPMDSETRDQSLLPVEVPWREVMDVPRRLGISEKMASDVEPDVVIERTVGLKVSLLYLPVWYVELSCKMDHQGIVMDATDGRVLVRGQQAADLLGYVFVQDALKPMRCEIKFLPFRCPNCGWDLPFGEKNLIYLCLNCRRLWTQSEKGFVELTYNVVSPPPKSREDELLWLPCWRITPKVLSQDSKASRSTMRALLWPLRGLRQEERPSFIYIPASSFPNPRAHLELARRLSIAQANFLWGAFQERGKIKTTEADLGPREAAEMVVLLLAAGIPFRNRTALEDLRQMRLEVEDLRLCFVPFSSEPLFWRQPHTGAAFPLAQVKRLIS